jgi:hypothetical protein
MLVLYMLNIINLFFICFIEHMDIIEMGLENQNRKDYFEGLEKRKR